MSFACYLQFVKVPPKLFARTVEGSGATFKQPDLFHGIGCTYLLYSFTLIYATSTDSGFGKISLQNQIPNSA